MSIFNTWDQRQSRTPQLRVTARLASVDPQAQRPLMFVMDAVNIGDLPVTLTAAGVILPDGSEYIWPPAREGVARYQPLYTPLYVIINPAKHHLYSGPVAPVANRLSQRGYKGTVRLRPFYRDYKHATYKAKPLKFDVEHWLKPKAG